MIIDTFIFNKDFNALEIRLAELYDFVDLFVISEVSYTHSGKQKPLYLTENLDKFSKYQDKIKIVTNRRKFFTSLAPIRESRQRQLISRYLNTLKLGKQDIIIHSDCDEIPRKSLLINLSQSKHEINVLLELTAYSTRLNLYDGIWRRGRVISGNLYRSIAVMRQDIFIFQNFDLRRHKLPFLRVPIFFSSRYFGLWKIPKPVFKKPSLEVISNGGWHFNNLFNFEQLVQKVDFSVHTELNTIQTHDKLKERYQSGCEIYTGRKLDLVIIDDTYPESIKNNLQKWDEYIY